TSSRHVQYRIAEPMPPTARIRSIGRSDRRSRPSWFAPLNNGSTMLEFGQLSAIASGNKADNPRLESEKLLSPLSYGSGHARAPNPCRPTGDRQLRHVPATKNPYVVCFNVRSQSLVDDRVKLIPINTSLSEIRWFATFKEQSRR